MFFYQWLKGHNTQCWLMVGQRGRRWTNIKTILGQRIVFTGSPISRPYSDEFNTNKRGSQYVLGQSIQNTISNYLHVIITFVLTPYEYHILKAFTCIQSVNFNIGTARTYPADTRRWSNVGLTLDQRREVGHILGP